MLLSYAVYVVLLGQVTGNGSINVYGWLFTGLCIAAAREALRRSQPVVRASLPAQGARAASRAPRPFASLRTPRRKQMQ